jgi:hypothetical protein
LRQEAERADTATQRGAASLGRITVLVGERAAARFRASPPAATHFAATASVYDGLQGCRVNSFSCSNRKP